jgi:hypothetical protein
MNACESTWIVGEHGSYRALRDRRVRSNVRDVGDEPSEQAIALVDAGDRATCEEAVAEISDRALDLALVSGLADDAEPGLDAHRGAEREQRGMEARDRTDALEHDDLGIVEQPLPGHAAESGRTADEGPAQRMDGQVDDELAPHRAGVCEHHHEHPQRALPAGDGELADVGPVDLGHLPRQRLGQEVGRPPGPGPDERDVLAQRPHRSEEAALSDHVVEPGREQLRIPVERLVDERTIGVDDARAKVRGRARGAEPEHPPDLVRVGLELGRDRADRPVLGVVQAHDLRLELGGALHRTPRNAS